MSSASFCAKARRAVPNWYLHFILMPTYLSEISARFCTTLKNTIYLINCDVSLANGELHQACGHVMLSAWVTKRRPYAVGKLYAPPSLFIQFGSFRIQIDSLTCLVFRCPSLSKILAPDQTWFSFATYDLLWLTCLFRSARVNVLLLINSTSFRCSSCFFP